MDKKSLELNQYGFTTLSKKESLEIDGGGIIAKFFKKWFGPNPAPPFKRVPITSFPEQQGIAWM